MCPMNVSTRVSAAGLHNMLAWRDANMPGTPVWVTEWGWDAARPGEVCGASTAQSVSLSWRRLLRHQGAVPAGTEGGGSFTLVFLCK
jgi:hypothetical protein